MGNNERLDLEDFEDFSTITSLNDAAEEPKLPKDEKVDSKLSSVLFYIVWENMSPYIRKFDEEYFHNSEYY